MDAMEAILTRRSTRRFADKPIPKETLETLLRAAMASPTAVNARDWAFLVITDKEMLNKMADVNGPAAGPLRKAAAGILICGDLHRAFVKAPDFWVIDGAIAAENTLIAAQALGLGAVWLGTWPRADAVLGQKTLFDLPEHILPHSILALGWPEGDLTAPRPDRYEEEKVHWEKW